MRGTLAPAVRRGQCRTHHVGNAPRAGTSGSPVNLAAEKIEEAAFVEFPRLRLPLPERTGSDRDELLCPHGFVDRAYSVFLRRCVATNQYCSPTTATRCESVPPLALLRPRGGAASRANLTRGVNEGRGYEPPGAFAPFTPTSVCCALPAVVVRKAARRWRCPTRARRFRTPEIPIPHRNLSPPRICELHRPHPVSERCTMQSACQYLPRRASARAMPTDHSRATS
jgi:hypothetical protein